MAGPVAIIGGTGALGFGLAARWARAGVDVIIGSRDEGRAREAAEKAGASQGLHNADAARAARVVFLTVPFRNQSENLTNLRDVLQEGQLLVDCTVPLAAAVSGRGERHRAVDQQLALLEDVAQVREVLGLVAERHGEEDDARCARRVGVVEPLRGARLLRRLAGPALVARADDDVDARA